MILIISYSGDEHTDIIEKHLEKKKASFFRLNTDQLSKRYRITISSSNKKIFCTIIDQKTKVSINCSQIKVVWLRRVRVSINMKLKKEEKYDYVNYSLSEVGNFLKLLFYTLNRADIFWCNDLDATNLIQENRLYQYFLANKVGLLTPDTYYTNNAQEVMCLLNRYSFLALKPIKQKHIAHINSKRIKAIFTNKINKNSFTKEQLKTSLKISPINLQEYIEKDYEIRLTIIGGKLFSCKIDSQASLRTSIDWRRYDFANVKHSIIKIPLNIERKIMKFMGASNLVYGAIDLIKTKDNKYIFLEINPAGQWQWIENITGMPISKNIALYLKQKDEI